MGHPDESLRVIDIAIIRGDVEVADDADVVGRLCVRGEISMKAIEPPQLVLVVVVIEAPPIRYVAAGHPKSGTGRPQNARIGIGIIAIEKVRTDVFKADSAQDRDAVPLPLSVVRALVASVGELVVRKVLVAELRFLQAQHVGPQELQPLQHPRHSHVQRVDIPRSDPHIARIYRAMRPSLGA